MSTLMNFCNILLYLICYIPKKQSETQNFSNSKRSDSVMNYPSTASYSTSLAQVLLQSLDFFKVSCILKTLLPSRLPPSNVPTGVGLTYFCLGEELGSVNPHKKRRYSLLFHGLTFYRTSPYWEGGLQLCTLSVSKWVNSILGCITSLVWFGKPNFSLKSFFHLAT